MHPREILLHQVLADLEKQHELILRYAAGDRSAKPLIARLEGSVEIKRALLSAAELERRV